MAVGSSIWLGTAQENGATYISGFVWGPKKMKVHVLKDLQCSEKHRHIHRLHNVVRRQVSTGAVGLECLDQFEDFKM